MEEWWGSKERLLQDLFGTKFLHDPLQKHLKQVEETCRQLYLQQYNSVATQARQTMLVEINKNLGTIATQLLKGTRVTNATYNKHRFLESFETQIEANQRKKLEGTHRRTIPKHLCSIELIESLKILVKDSGGGKVVQIGKGWTLIAQQLAKTFENENPAIAKTLQQNHANQFVKEIYIKSSHLFDQIDRIKLKIKELGEIENVANQNFWEQICTELQFFQSDAVWLLQQVCTYSFPQYSPTQHVVCR